MGGKGMGGYRLGLLPNMTAPFSSVFKDGEHVEGRQPPLARFDLMCCRCLIKSSTAGGGYSTS